MTSSSPAATVIVENERPGFATNDISFGGSDPTATGWDLADLTGTVPLQVTEGGGDPIFSVVPFEADDAYGIVARIGDRAMTSGDSKTGLYSSTLYAFSDCPSSTCTGGQCDGGIDIGEACSGPEHQAVYGINLYHGPASKPLDRGSTELLNAMPIPGTRFHPASASRGLRRSTMALRKQMTIPGRSISLLAATSRHSPLRTPRISPAR